MGLIWINPFFPWVLIGHNSGNHLKSGHYRVWALWSRAVQWTKKPRVSISNQNWFGKNRISLLKAILFEGDSSHLVSSRLVRRRLAVPLVSSVAVPLDSSVAIPLCRVHRRLQPSPSVSLSRLVWYRFCLCFWFNLFEMGLMGFASWSLLTHWHVLIYFSGSPASLLPPLLLSAPALDLTKELSVCWSVLLHH